MTWATPRIPLNTPRLARRTLLALGLVTALSGCAPLLVGGAVGTGIMVANDRRTSGIQLEDQGIELRASNRLRDQMGTRARAGVTSFNRRVLLTGEVASERDKALAVQIVSQVENVASVVDELAVLNSPSLTQRSADTITTGRVKAALVDAKDLSANHFKVVTERGTTYLMGLVTRTEADRATTITRQVPGVQRVVRVLEVLSDEDIRRMDTTAPPRAAAQK